MKSKKKIATVVGARPQFVKMAAFHRTLHKHTDTKHLIIHTGQHYDENMSEVFFREMDIPQPDINLGIGGGTHGQNTGRMIEQIESILIDHRPDWVVVFGDTDSTFAAALAAAKIHIPVAHVEAGLRSFNRKMPEEINRILTDHCSDLLFAPSDIAVSNLKHEGISDDKVVWSGDIMYDVHLMFQEKVRLNSHALGKWGLSPKNYVLATIHRAENTNSSAQLSKVIQQLSAVDTTIILPLHPRTRNALKNFKLELPDHVQTIDPVGYLDMALLEANASFIITDSGGIQKEAYFHKVPCITMREETEWGELVDAKVNFVVGQNLHKMKNALDKILSGNFNFEQQLYGPGNTAEVIIQNLK